MAEKETKTGDVESRKEGGMARFNNAKMYNVVEFSGEKFRRSRKDLFSVIEIARTRFSRRRDEDMVGLVFRDACSQDYGLLMQRLALK
jgi:hypothetical protein